ncbi:hypothetical protein AB0C40_01330 [Streptomyces brevispora]|uniref:ATP-binding protein n=1 Tax=Streptomyces brevispora TaxID=887462 RepID=A0A561V0Y6_9ACTN|nr:hypothetical protein [Streptomyces brevispora]TWG05276.1 hypothetical protein FHX80_113753 [Streptomyces brevispora]WSC13693.1 hypothetical protein OIE64_13150 [Streptomyces brevispora]
MKQSAVRTFGVAVVGAAFAAAAAGTASASALPIDTATSALPVAGALANATSTLPVQDTATKLLGTGQTKAVNDVTAPAKGLLGGLPTGGLKTGGLSANGLPLGR